jgi:hypothetical protein
MNIPCHPEQRTSPVILSEVGCAKRGPRVEGPAVAFAFVLRTIEVERGLAVAFANSTQKNPPVPQPFRALCEKGGFARTPMRTAGLLTGCFAGVHARSKGVPIQAPLGRDRAETSGKPTFED